jgi:hypothetical protein
METCSIWVFYKNTKEFKTQKTTSKTFTPVFWDRHGILLVDYIEKGVTTTAKYYVALLDKLKQQGFRK